MAGAVYATDRRRGAFSSRCRRPAEATHCERRAAAVVEFHDLGIATIRIYDGEVLTVLYVGELPSSAGSAYIGNIACDPQVL